MTRMNTHTQSEINAKSELAKKRTLEHHSWHSLLSCCGIKTYAICLFAIYEYILKIKLKMWLTEAYYKKMLKLIKCVHKRPSLWNTAHNNYYNRCVSRQLWSEIEDECDMERK